MGSKRVFSKVLAALAIAGSASGHAAPVCVDITAKVRFVDDRGNFLRGTITQGSVVTGRYVYESTTQDTNLLPTVGNYLHQGPSAFGFTLKIGESTFKTNPADADFLVQLANDHGNPLSDSYLVRNNKSLFDLQVEIPRNSPWYGTAPNNRISWQLIDMPKLSNTVPPVVPPAALSSTALPATAPDLSKWPVQVSGLDIRSSTRFNYFNIKSVVTQAKLVNVTDPKLCLNPPPPA